MRLAASVRASKSVGLSIPERRASDLIRASLARRRCISAWSDISRVKKATGICLFTAMLAAMERAKAVLPTEGRAPMTMNSDF